MNLRDSLSKKFKEITLILSHEDEHSGFNFRSSENKIIEKANCYLLDHEKFIVCTGLGFCFGSLFRKFN